MSTAGQREIELIAVVDARAHDHLTVHGDAMIEQHAQPPQRRCAALIAQHLRPQPRISGVDADVERRETFGDDALEVGFGESGQRREIAVQEREAVVVVLEIQALAHALGQLVDEAELAMVVTGLHDRTTRRVDLETQWLTSGLDDLDRQTERPAAIDFDGEIGVVGEQSVRMMSRAPGR